MKVRARGRAAAGIRKSALGVIALVVLAGQPARAGGGGDLEDLERRLREGPTAADLVAYANRNSPMIEAARQAWKATVERHRVVTAWPDPEVMFEESTPLEDMWMGRLTQMVPFPGKLSRAGDVVEAEARIARIEADRTARDVTLQIREAFHELLYVGTAKAVVRANQDLLAHLRKVAETGYVADRATLVDVTKAQSQVAQLEYDALLLRELEETQKARLNSLLSRAPDAPIGPLAEEPPAPVAYSLEEIYAIAPGHQEEVRSAEARVQKAETEAGLMRWEQLPDFTVGLLKDPIDDGGRDAVGFQVGMTLPLWFGKNRGRIAQAEAEAEMARSMRRARLDETHAMVRETWFRLQNSERLVALYRDRLLPQAANSLEIAETWYRQGQGSFSDFVETQSVYYNFQLALARARADYGKFLARLERLAGQGLTVREEPAPAAEGER